MSLTDKQEAFVREYLIDFNATQAAIRAGYSKATAKQQGSRLLTNVDISEAIHGKIMSADEVLLRLGDMARGDFADIFDITQMGFVIDLAKAKENNKTKLIKKIKQRTTITTKGDEETEVHDIEVELYNAQDALVTIGKHHKLFTDKVDLTTGGDKLNGGVTDDGVNKSISALADAVREIVLGSDAEQKGSVGST